MGHLLFIVLFFLAPYCTDTYSQEVTLGKPATAPVVHRCEWVYTYTETPEVVDAAAAVE